MMTILLATLCFLGILYALVDLWLFRGLASLERRQLASKNENTPLPCPRFAKISVLISARNEEKRLPACIETLLKQNDPSIPWDIWIADDRSVDGTAEFLRDLVTRHPSRVHVLPIQECPVGWSPKKHAITRLVEASEGDLLLLTDADCLLPPNWLVGMAASFQTGIHMVAGFSRYHPKTGITPDQLFGVQALDFLSHHIVASAAIAGGNPITCCGNNLAYTREFFQRVGGYGSYQGVTSGDDDLLLQKAAELKPYCIDYCIDPSTFVSTFAEESAYGVWNQRKRWASKTVKYRPITVVLLSSVFLFYSSILILFLLSPFLGFGIFLMAISAFAWKTIWDGLVTRRGAYLLGSADLLHWFPMTALLHIPGIVGAVLFGILGQFRWKDQGFAGAGKT